MVQASSDFWQRLLFLLPRNCPLPDLDSKRMQNSSPKPLKQSKGPLFYIVHTVVVQEASLYVGGIGGLAAAGGGVGGTLKVPPNQ